MRRPLSQVLVSDAVCLDHRDRLRARHEGFRFLSENRRGDGLIAFKVFRPGGQDEERDASPNRALFEIGEVQHREYGLIEQPPGIDRDGLIGVAQYQVENC